MTGIVIGSSEWRYLSLELTPDPLVLQEPLFRSQFEQLEVDSLTWKQVVLASMKKMYGIVGEAAHFDVLHRTKKRAIIRVQPEDEDKFKTSLFSYVTVMESFLGSSSSCSDLECYVRVAKSAEHLGMVAESEFIEI
ncbi:uncharacterized protein CANTADRAFT_102061 [Suhomyces tanzawaensis NRRL Y-17324]|uniref:Ribonucleases P/MRP subunit Pop8-like domain-containing protein n=1 Tax=Suhomyces tanzawaensis NRRL Y-17324 TaxID=984487 RepID=A0A1E4SFC1_9ASCO|nr:uncharacterized protein CANTADRAFT_102061 [Suhomyces tanzawaensis NRRL Y-17324]ODV78208.1 hypothetical protein CANTADRAFT_102061 [Suhomyces tanzawaensis NRRL Y-17324]